MHKSLIICSVVTFPEDVNTVKLILMERGCDEHGAFAVWIVLNLHCLGSSAHSPVKHPESMK